MTKIILFVIALQVVLGILAKRKARRNAEEAARGSSGNGGNGGESGNMATAETPSLPRPSRAPSAWGTDGHSEDESESDWDEHHSDEDERSHRDTRRQQRRLPEESASRRTQGHEGERDEHPVKRTIDKGKAAELGKDLLSQLAKELGLEIPTDKPQPRPVPKPQPVAQPAQPAKSQPPAKVSASATIAAKQAAASAKMAQSRAKDRQTEISRRSQEAYAKPGNRDAGENTPRRDPNSRSIGDTSAPMSSRVTAASTARANLMDGKSLRNAFILKTILDKPLSLHPRRPGEA